MSIQQRKNYHTFRIKFWTFNNTNCLFNNLLNFMCKSLNYMKINWDSTKQTDICTFTVTYTM